MKVLLRGTRTTMNLILTKKKMANLSIKLTQSSTHGIAVNNMFEGMQQLTDHVIQLYIVE
jgi:hypothetical protein